ncbi:sel1 repeat family protein [Chiayiivirga flava]|uniref:Sel1 repeat family protein n=1 Tax=Chiayiivirga flava TaxID=659595 RepID=A0A7W8D821_9GAMM|nr:sel1 repeat family protein [Chiayiivirga flava]MBB5209590.1 hypothetical protein [Chiayiivirga flava]
MSITRPVARWWRAASLICIALVATAAVAHAQAPDDIAPEAVQSQFEKYHPDLKFRRMGLEAYERGDHADALRLFRKSAYYGDKASQGMVGQMLWKGEGSDADPALAYAWMDLAAERGYPTFVGLREHFWMQMDAATRERSIEQGQAVYARYGDAVAKPRMESQLRRGRSKVTGSRTGFVGNLTILVPSATGWTRMRGEEIHDPRLWKEYEYWQWQDETWRASPRGVVEVGPLSSGDAPRSDIEKD